ncbi:nucleotide diphosphatase [Ascoidea rubescens DSM 1968]|uniref:Septum formation protein Maf n=1 Tax=Ascoidea rubescens DSM 1968 TaxID=1344418 RepID=A0A1D2VBX7_9ASCO|nr:septum formation protein Maf [Ascoidea rubescens DSM 1968]ODV59062.1 septum formation protein Maf [Ascoidea rubescens DSM 1968]
METLSLINDHKNYRFVLASTSPRRLDILKQMGISNIEIYPSSFPENLNKTLLSPKDYVLQTAVKKGEFVYNEIISQKHAQLDINNITQKESQTITQKLNKNLLILSSDTIVESNGTINEKPIDKSHNFLMLKDLLNSSKKNINQSVMTAIALFNENGLVASKVEVTQVIMDNNLTDADLLDYVETGEGIGAAGGYKIQGLGGILFNKIDGDFYNVVGLPLKTTFNLIKDNI